MYIKFTKKELASRLGDEIKAASIYERLLEYDYEALEDLKLILPEDIKTDIFECVCGSCGPEVIVYLKTK